MFQTFLLIQIFAFAVLCVQCADHHLVISPLMTGIVKVNECRKQEVVALAPPRAPTVKSDNIQNKFEIYGAFVSCYWLFVMLLQWI